MTYAAPLNIYIAGRFGTRRWCVARRATQRLRDRYDVIFTPRQFTAIKTDFKALFGLEG